jgi:hypothetical protein
MLNGDKKIDNVCTICYNRYCKENRTAGLPERKNHMDNCKAWDYAIGIVQVDGIKPSDEFLELVEKEKRGEITNEDIRKALYQKYKVKEEE